MINKDPIEVDDRTVNTRPRPLLTAVGSQGWAELRRERARERRLAVVRVVLYSFAVGFVVGVMSRWPW